jgi:hypothetical protein
MTYQTNHLKLPILSFLCGPLRRSLSRTPIRDTEAVLRNEPTLLSRCPLWQEMNKRTQFQNRPVYYNL